MLGNLHIFCTDPIGIPFCPEENVTFVNMVETSKVHIGTVPTGEACNISVTFSTCDDPDDEVVRHKQLQVSQSNAVIEIDSVEMFYGNNVVIETQNDCFLFCRGSKIYIPDMNPTG